MKSDREGRGESEGRTVETLCTTSPTLRHEYARYWKKLPEDLLLCEVKYSAIRTIVEVKEAAATETSDTVRPVLPSSFCFPVAPHVPPSFHFSVAPRILRSLSRNSRTEYSQWTDTLPDTEHRLETPSRESVRV